MWQNTPSTSQEEKVVNISIGSEKYRFHAVDISEIEPTEPEQAYAWIYNLHPVTEPKPLSGLFKCEICHQYMTLRKTLLEHVKMKHSTSNNFNCYKCGKTHDCNEMLVVHLSAEHDSNNE